MLHPTVLEDLIKERHAEIYRIEARHRLAKRVIQAQKKRPSIWRRGFTFLLNFRLQPQLATKQIQRETSQQLISEQS